MEERQREVQQLEGQEHMGKGAGLVGSRLSASPATLSKGATLKRAACGKPQDRALKKQCSVSPLRGEVKLPDAPEVKDQVHTSEILCALAKAGIPCWLEGGRAMILRAWGPHHTPALVLSATWMGKSLHLLVVGNDDGMLRKLPPRHAHIWTGPLPGQEGSCWWLAELTASGCAEGSAPLVWTTTPAPPGGKLQALPRHPTFMLVRDLPQLAVLLAGDLSADFRFLGHPAATQNGWELLVYDEGDALRPAVVLGAAYVRTQPPPAVAAKMEPGKTRSGSSFRSTQEQAEGSGTGEVVEEEGPAPGAAAAGSVVGGAGWEVLLLLKYKGFEHMGVVLMPLSSPRIWWGEVPVQSDLERLKGQVVVKDGNRSERQRKKDLDVETAGSWGSWGNGSNPAYWVYKAKTCCPASSAAAPLLPGLEGWQQHTVVVRLESCVPTYLEFFIRDMQGLVDMDTFWAAARHMLVMQKRNCLAFHCLRATVDPCSALYQQLLQMGAPGSALVAAAQAAAAVRGAESPVLVQLVVLLEPVVLPGTRYHPRAARKPQLTKNLTASTNKAREALFKALEVVPEYQQLLYQVPKDKGLILFNLVDLFWFEVSGSWREEQRWGPALAGSIKVVQDQLEEEQAAASLAHEGSSKGLKRTSRRGGSSSSSQCGPKQAVRELQGLAKQLCQEAQSRAPCPQDVAQLVVPSCLGRQHKGTEQEEEGAVLSSTAGAGVRCGVDAGGLEPPQGARQVELDQGACRCVERLQAVLALVGKVPSGDVVRRSQKRGRVDFFSWGLCTPLYNRSNLAPVRAFLAGMQPEKKHTYAAAWRDFSACLNEELVGRLGPTQSHRLWPLLQLLPAEMRVGGLGLAMYLTVSSAVAAHLDKEDLLGSIILWLADLGQDGLPLVHPPCRFVNHSLLTAVEPHHGMLLQLDSTRLVHGTVKIPEGAEGGAASQQGAGEGNSRGPAMQGDIYGLALVTKEQLVRKTLGHVAAVREGREEPCCVCTGDWRHPSVCGLEGSGCRERAAAIVEKIRARCSKGGC